MEKVWENNNDNKKKDYLRTKYLFLHEYSEWNVCFIIIFASLYKNLSICH